MCIRDSETDLHDGVGGSLHADTDRVKAEKNFVCGHSPALSCLRDALPQALLTKAPACSVNTVSQRRASPMSWVTSTSVVPFS